jgi:hypothetical protein
MNKQMQIYENYKNKFKDNPKYEVKYATIEMNKYKELDEMPKLTKTGAMSIKVVESPIGEIIELHDSFANGMMVKAFIFKNMNEWRKYYPVATFSEYFEY